MNQPGERVRVLRFVLGIGGVVAFLYSLIFGIPLGTETHKVIKYGGSEGARIEGRELYHHFFAILSIEGGFRRDYAITHEVWLVGEHRGTRLKHLERDDSGQYAVFLDRMYPVAGTDRWVAFRYTDVKRGQVTLDTIVFDKSRVIHSRELKDVVRDGLELEQLCTYYIAPRQGNALVDVVTLEGVKTYDVMNNTVTSKGGAPADAGAVRTAAQASCGCRL